MSADRNEQDDENQNDSDGGSIEELQDGSKSNLLYGINSAPPWSITIFLSFQQFVTMFASIVTVPFVIAPALCIPSDNIARAYILSTILFICGLVTLIQIVFGVRLPITQGPSASFYAPIFAIMALPQWKCEYDVNAQTPENYTDYVWQSRMREIQGAISVSAVLPVLLSVTGAVTYLVRYITPLTVVPTVTLIGLSLFETASGLASENWAVSISTIVLLLIFSQYLSNTKLPFPAYRRGKGCGVGWIRWFKFFPIVSALALIWLVCYVLTITDVFPEGDGGRTDIKANILTESPWFRFPYPFQWGVPTVTAASVLGMLAAIVACMVESIGDYYSCAKICDIPLPPPHAVNRGILIEGLGCILAGLFGTGTGTTSFADNIGTISITKVASRRVIILSAIYMMVAAVLMKIPAVLSTLPDPVIGGMYTFIFSMVMAVGLSSIQFVDLNSSRNLLILGFSIFFGLSLSDWMSNNDEAVNTGNATADEIITVLLSTGMLVGGVTAFILDNTVPGTIEERGLHMWTDISKGPSAGKVIDASAYNLPFGMSWISRHHAIFRYIPFCPNYIPFECRVCSCCRRQHAHDDDDDTPLSL